jgi:mannosyltransferase OCH1-like enzyme
MIPKKLHYCWLSGEKMPKIIVECMKTWREIGSEYELILWDRDKFDINSIDFVAEACSVKKWASASDYIRLYALYIEGGIYLDSDVIIQKNFSDFLNHDFFSCIEYHQSVVEKNNSKALLYEDGSVKNPVMRVPGIGIQAAVLGSIKGHPFLKDCLTWYEQNHFILSNGGGGGKITII